MLPKWLKDIENLGKKIMLYSNKVYISEIIKEDRLEAKYYHPKYTEALDAIKRFPWRKLDDLSVKVKKGIFDLSPDEYKEQGTPFIRISNIKNLTIDEHDLVCISDDIHEMHPTTTLKPKDIVFSKIGTLGKLAQIPSYMQEVNISQNIIGVSLKDEFNKDYILSFLISTYALLQIEKRCKQQLQDKLNIDDVKEILIPLVPKNQQSEIANLVRQADDKSVRALEKIRQAQTLFIQALGIDLKQIKKENFYKVNFGNSSNLWTPRFYYPLYQNTLKEIKKKFETIKLRDIPADISKGDEVGSENYKEYLEKTYTDVPFIRTSDIVNYEIDNYPDFYISEDIYNELNQDIRAGDVLFTKDGKIGLPAMLTENDKCILSSGIARLRITGKFLSHYVFTVLSTEIGLYQALQRTVTAATIPHLRLDRLVEIEIPILSEDKQEEISELIKDAFNFKNERKALVKQAKDIVERIVGMQKQT